MDEGGMADEVDGMVDDGRRACNGCLSGLKN